MGDNSNYQSGNENDEILNSIIKINFFENKNLIIKKINCGGRFIDSFFSIFLTG
jgi:hypothetical protein